MQVGGGLARALTALATVGLLAAPLSGCSQDSTAKAMDECAATVRDADLPQLVNSISLTSGMAAEAVDQWRVIAAQHPAFLRGLMWSQCARRTEELNCTNAPEGMGMVSSCDRRKGKRSVVFNPFYEQAKRDYAQMKIELGK